MGYITRQMPHYSCSAASRLLLGARAIQVPPGRSAILYSFFSLLRCCKLFGMRPGTASRLAYRLSRILNRRRLEFLLSIVCNSNKPIRSSFNGTPEGYKAASSSLRFPRLAPTILVGSWQETVQIIDDHRAVDPSPLYLHRSLQCRLATQPGLWQRQSSQ